jgi:peptidoglycan/xylan/chitin deacetylase (PgdA/CDA1 family)
MAISNLKSRLVQAVGPFGGYRVCRWLTRSTPKVLMYHRFSEQASPGCVQRAEFARQVDYLARHFNVMRMDQVFDALATDPAGLDNAVVITVDDGYLDFYEIAFPVLRAAGLPATLFLTTRFVDGDFWLWPDRIRYILEQSSELQALDLPGFRFSGDLQLGKQERDMLWLRIASYLLSIDEKDKLLWMNNFARQQGVRVPDNPTSEFRAVDWTQVREMTEANIEMGAHSRTHPSLGKIPQEQLAYEILGSVEDVEQQTGRRPLSFCYPNGQPGDYTEQVKSQVRRAGCMGAVTAFYDRDVTNDCYELRRFAASENPFQYAKSVNGVEMLAARWLNISSASQGQVC